VTKTEVVDGVVRVHVRGRALRQPELGNQLTDAEKAWRSLGGAERPKLTPRPGLRPSTKPTAGQKLGNR